jgi:hypothetical protein
MRSAQGTAPAIALSQPGIQIFFASVIGAYRTSETVH